MVVVVDSSPLIILAKIEQFELLHRLFGKIYIPDAVYKEVVERGKGRPGDREVKQAKWIERSTIQDNLAVQLLLSEIRDGDAESIVLAKEVNADLLILDDNKARIIAKLSKLNVRGTVALLIMGYNKGYITDFKLSMDNLIKKGFYIAEKTYQNILDETLK